MLERAWVAGCLIWLRSDSSCSLARDLVHWYILCLRACTYDRRNFAEILRLAQRPSASIALLARPNNLHITVPILPRRGAPLHKNTRFATYPIRLSQDPKLHIRMFSIANGTFKSIIVRSKSICLFVCSWQSDGLDKTRIDDLIDMSFWDSSNFFRCYLIIRT